MVEGVYFCIVSFFDVTVELDIIHSTVKQSLFDNYLLILHD